MTRAIPELVAYLGLAVEPREVHTANLASGLKALTNDKRIIFQAASHVQRALDHLHGRQSLVDEDDEATA